MRTTRALGGGRRPSVSAPIRVVMAAGPAAWTPVARESLAAVRGARVVAEAADADQAVAVVGTHRPSVVLVDQALAPPGPAGLVAALRRACPAARIIAVSPAADDARALDVIRQGGHGLMAEAALASQLAKVVRCLAAGQVWLTRRQEGQALTALWQTTEPGR